jgi:cytochrome P450
MGRKIVEERYQNPSDERDLLNAFIASTDSKGIAIHPDQVRGEVIATLVAGGDTTAMSILGCMGFLLRSPAAFATLKAEVDATIGENHLRGKPISFSEVSKLPYLDAVIHETLRLSPSIAIAFTRIVPEEGREVLPGLLLPCGVEVGVNNWVMGRNRVFYGFDADEFRPERWLEDEQWRKAMKDYEFAFGHGSRV